MTNLKTPLIKYKCPYCGQETEKALHLELKQRERRIYNAVLNAGDKGISPQDLLVRMYADDEWPTPGGPVVLRVQIHYLNNILKQYGQHIDGDKSHGYRLVSTK